MKKFELIVGIIAIFGILLKIFNIPGGGLLAVYATAILGIFYYVFSFAIFNDIRLRDVFKKASYKDTNAKRIIGAIVLGWSISLVIIGGVFKLQLWGDAYLVFGLLNTGLILLIATIFYFRSKAKYYKRVFKKIAIYGGLGLVLYLIPATTFLNIYYGNNHRYTEHPNFAKHYKKLLADPYNLELREQMEQMRDELEQVKFEKWLKEERHKKSR